MFSLRKMAYAFMVNKPENCYIFSVANEWLQKFRIFEF